MCFLGGRDEIRHDHFVFVMEDVMFDFRFEMMSHEKGSCDWSKCFYEYLQLKQKLKSNWILNVYHYQYIYLVI